MADVGGKSESDKQKETSTAAIHKRLTDAGQFSYGALCALSLRKLFEEDWNRQFNKETLSTILNGLEQPKQVQEAIQAMYEGVGQDDMHPFVDVILSEDALQGDASPIISELIGFAVAQGNYDARMRALIKNIAWRLRIGWDHMEEIECQLAETITSEKYEMSEEEKAEQRKKAKHRKYKRAALIGLATVTGGTLIGLTGGLAAPLVAAGAGAIIGGAGAAALGSAAGVAIIGSLFGVAGAGLTGYKMKRRIGAIEEFEFEPLISGGPLQLQTVHQQLHITIAITGWINKKMTDFKQPWQNLAESQEQYALRWESKYLQDLGQALDYIFNSAVSMATHEALKYTVLSTLMAAITWPAALLSVSQVIDNPWSVALQRAVAAGRQLAEVLLSREQGKRPVTLIGYSLGGRVIYYCLEEMAKRKGSEGIVEDVVVLGAPVTSDPKSWSAFQRVVAGRIINGYCRGDWLLKFLYRTASVQIHIAGLGPVKWNNHRMHNIDLSDVVSGHLDYVEQLDTILRVTGIRVRQGMKIKKKTTSLGLSMADNGGTSTKSSSSSSIPDTASSNFKSSESQTVIADSSDSDTQDRNVSGSVSNLPDQTVKQFEQTTDDKHLLGVEAAANSGHADTPKSSSSPGKSVAGKLKNFFSRTPSPEQKGRTQETHDSRILSSNDENEWDMVLEDVETDHVENFSVAKNKDKLNSATITDESGNTPSLNDCAGEENTERKEQEGEDHKEKDKEETSRQAGEKVKRDEIQENKREEGEEKQPKKEKEQAVTGTEQSNKGEQETDGVSAEQVTVTQKEGTMLQHQDSEEDTYTSSNPCSTPGEEADKLQGL